MSYRIVNRKKRFLVGITTVTVLVALFTAGFIAQKPFDFGPKVFGLDIYSDSVKETLPLYEASGDDDCVKVVNEYITATTSKLNAKAPVNPLDAPLIRASAPKCKASSPRPVGYEKLGKDGFVLLMLNINKDGKVERGEIEKTSGFPDLDSLGLQQVVANWRFEPCKKLDKVVACKHKIKFRWASDL